jgi:hypothetical protein
MHTLLIIFSQDVNVTSCISDLSKLVNAKANNYNELDLQIKKNKWQILHQYGWLSGSLHSLSLCWFSALSRRLDSMGEQIPDSYLKLTCITFDHENVAWNFNTCGGHLTHLLHSVQKMVEIITLFFMNVPNMPP